MTAHDIPDPNRRSSTTEALEDLVTANNESNVTMLALVEHIKRDLEARDRKIETVAASTRSMRKLALAMVVMMLVLMGIAAINATNLAAQRATARDAKATNALLLDCVNARGACGQLNAQQQRLILDEVKKYELTGFYCLRTNPQTADPRGASFLQCMERLYPGGPKLQGRP